MISGSVIHISYYNTSTEAHPRRKRPHSDQTPGWPCPGPVARCALIQLKGSRKGAGSLPEGSVSRSVELREGAARPSVCSARRFPWVSQEGLLNAAAFRPNCLGNSRRRGHAVVVLEISSLLKQPLEKTRTSVVCRSGCTQRIDLVVNQHRPDQAVRRHARCPQRRGGMSSLGNQVRFAEAWAGAGGTRRTDDGIAQVSRQGDSASGPTSAALSTSQQFALAGTRRGTSGCGAMPEPRSAVDYAA